MDANQAPTLPELRAALREQTWTAWRRTLSFGDELQDRWDKARFLGWGEGTSVYDSAIVMGDVHVGDHCWIGPYTLLDGSAGLTIGSHCDVSAGVHIYTHDTLKRVLTAGVAGVDRAPVHIGDCVYIGPHAIITRGVSVGDHSVIGANSFVNRDVPAFTLVAGSPAVPKGRVVVEGDQVRIEPLAPEATNP